jgi:hypothetical protein
MNDHTDDCAGLDKWHEGNPGGVLPPVGEMRPMRHPSQDARASSVK